jgi:hypothetical protein
VATRAQAAGFTASSSCCGSSCGIGGKAEVIPIIDRVRLLIHRGRRIPLARSGALWPAATSISTILSPDWGVSIQILSEYAAGSISEADLRYS